MTNNKKASLRLRLLKPLMALVAMFTAIGIHASQLQQQVFAYSKSPELKLTRYSLADNKNAHAKGAPCIIFAFGGGFTHGTRDDARYQDYFRFMAEQGFVVCTIDYRTTLSEFNPSGGTDALADYGRLLAQAINTATTDYLAATAYILSHAHEWGIDPSKIIASGSSAGAITALEAEYTLVNNRPALFPPQFNYAGLVTFAGAVFTLGQPQNLDKFCPAMLFQGDADMQVPYNSLVLGPAGLYGSDFLASKFKEAGLTGAFVTVKGAGHEMALTPMTQNLYDIAGFIHALTAGKLSTYSITTATVPGRGPYKTDFTIMDYIRGNM